MIYYITSQLSENNSIIVSFQGTLPSFICPKAFKFHFIFLSSFIFSIYSVSVFFYWSENRLDIVLSP